MNQAESEIPPRVLISYSYDSPDHRRWVISFAGQLRARGVDVKLDVWEVDPGDDLTHFMETEIAASARVVMVCTEPYVRKANEGIGGVGYEKMIVTGELLRNLNTSKFIPIIRQKGTAVLPTCVSSRKYINFSEDQNEAEAIEELVRTIHKAPAHPKPRLGPNPFADSPLVAEIATTVTDLKRFTNNQLALTAVVAYQTALDLARTGDTVGWRKLVQQAKRDLGQNLDPWRSNRRDVLLGRTQDPLPALSLFLQALESVIAIALAGIESGDSRFNAQGALLLDILQPREWLGAGLVSIVDIPIAAGFVYQMIHGATALHTGQLSLAASVARERVTDFYQRKSVAVNQHPGLLGSVHTFGSAKGAWSYLKGIAGQWQWLDDVFGSREEFLVGICSYGMLLNTLEFFDLLLAGHQETIRPGGPFFLDFPLFFEEEEPYVRRAAFNLLAGQLHALRAFSDDLGITDAQITDAWPRWIQLSSAGLRHQFPFRFEGLSHRELFGAS